MPPRSPDAAALLRHGSRTFHAASFLLPREVRYPARVLYAFCRLADDAVDLGDCPSQAIDDLERRLLAIYAGRPREEGVDVAFAEVVARYAIPHALPAALLEGFAWDTQRRRYDDLEAVLGYAARVAGSVGAMMTLIMGSRTRSAVARACDLGMAMQLTNIARDVGEDARAGRLYLPVDLMSSAGLDADTWLAHPHCSPALAAVVNRLLHEASRLYQRAASGIAELPPACRAGINAARHLYAEIGAEVARRGGDSVRSRAIVGRGRKAQVLLRAIAGVPFLPAPASAPPTPAAVFLVNALPDTGSAHPRSRSGGLARVLDLMLEIEQREYARRAGAGD